MRATLLLLLVVAGVVVAGAAPAVALAVPPCLDGDLNRCVAWVFTQVDSAASFVIRIVLH